MCLIGFTFFAVSLRYPSCSIQICVDIKLSYTLLTRLTTFSNVAPSSYPAVCAIVEHTATGCQTNRSDEVTKLNGRTESQHSNVVVTCVAVVIGMQDDSVHASGHFVGIAALLGLPTQVHSQLVWIGAEKDIGISQNKQPKRMGIFLLTDGYSGLKQPPNQHELMRGVNDL